MSTRIGVCPSCRQIARQIEMSEEQCARFAALTLGADKRAAQWRIHGQICGHCGMSVLTVWPRLDDAEKLLTILNAPEFPPEPEPARKKK